MKKLLLGSAIALLSVGTAGAQTLVSEDFESGTGSFTFSGNVAVISGADYVALAGGSGSAAAQANDFASFGAGNVAGNGIVSQSFTTIAGRLYTLTFDYGAFNSTSQALNYDVAGLASGSLVSPNGTSNLDNLFTSFSTTFVGDGSSTVLSFSSLSGAGDNADIFLDNVSLSGVPEPAAWALMILGFGAVGGAMRRRAKVRTAVSVA